MVEINYRLISSYIFVINIYYSFYKKYYIYTLLFSNLLISSVILHWLYFDFNYMENEIIFIRNIDKFNVSLVILYGLYLYIKKIFTKKNNFIIASLILYFFILCYFLWIYGFNNNKYCFDENKIYAARYHSLLHLFGSLGHLLIIIL